jgi:hypothetical protein
MHILNTAIKPFTVEQSGNLYKWAKFWYKIQRNYFVDSIKMRREKQAEDFILLNEFQKIYFQTDTDVFVNFDPKKTATSPTLADLVVVTDQKFSRYPCPVLLEKIRDQISKCPNLYLCLNRHYINIDDSYCDAALSDNYNLAITQWLKKGLPELEIIDLSQDYLDQGRSFTWVIPDRHYYIKQR